MGTINRITISGLLVLSVFASACVDDSGGEATPSPSPSGAAVGLCYQEIGLEWEELCKDPGNATISSSDCTVPQIMAVADPTASQLPDGFEPAPPYGASPLVFFNVIGYRCDEWASGNLSLGAGDVFFVSQGIQTPNSSTSTSFGHGYVFEVYTNSDILWDYFDRIGMPVAHATIAWSTLPTMPSSFALESGDVQIEFFAPTTGLGASLSGVLALVHGNATDYDELHIGDDGFCDNISPIAFRAEGGTLGEAFPTGVKADASAQCISTSVTIALA